LQPRRLTRCAATLAVLTLGHLAAWPLGAQSPPAPQPITALFLSDLHLNPFHDPAFLATLTGPSVPVPELIPSPALAAVQDFCRRLPDTPDALFRSSLAAIRPRAASVSFVTVSGDLLSHQFIRCFAAFVLRTEPAAADSAEYPILTPDQRRRYQDFVQNTVAYVTAQLRDTFPNTPIYYALGNNDSACGDYNLDANDEFLRRTAPLVAAAIAGNPTAATSAVLPSQFAADGSWQATGSYNVPLAALPNTRLIVFDDVFLAPDHRTCSGADNPATAKAELAWLTLQLQSLKPGQKVWIMAHIPPGIDLFSSIKRRHPVAFLKYDFAGLLAPYTGAIRLTIFAHTHIDDLTQLPAPDSFRTFPIQLKSVQSISPDHGNLPTFTLASIDPATSTLLSYTLITAAQSPGGYTWPAPDAPPPPPTWTSTAAASH
jgi:sphingomyelin phosphodiesterase acid-like 3